MTDAADIAAAEAELFASIRLSPIAGVVTDPRRPDNPICAANRAFTALTGYGEEELIGRNCRLLAGPETEEEARAALRAAVAQARPAMAELTNYRRDGTSFRNAVMIAPVFDEEGALAYFIGSQMDVTGTGAGDRAVRARARVAGLTPRQQQVLRLMAGGLRNKLIARELGIDEKTVKMHRAALLSRLSAGSSADAVRTAVEAGL